MQCERCFGWALKMQLVRIDPTAGIAAPARRRNGGIRAWTEEDVAAYEKRGRDNEYGSTSSSIRGSGAATPCGSGVNKSATA
jgi:hypothetical protein